MFPALPGQSSKAAASTDLLGALAGLNEEEQAAVKGELERKIMEQEKADEKRKRKAWKIASMVRPLFFLVASPQLERSADLLDLAL